MPFTKREPFWLVWRPDTKRVYYRHKTEESALKEAQRLADSNPGKKFHVLQALGRCTADKKDKSKTLTLKK